MINDRSDSKLSMASFAVESFFAFNHEIMLRHSVSERLVIALTVN